MFKKFTLLTIIFLFTNEMLIGQFSAMTFNIRFDNPNDGINAWQNRKTDVVNLIRAYDPKVFGLQEALLHQIQFLDSNLANYAWVGAGRDDGKLKGEFSPVFYDSTVFKLLDFATFWLSTTPEKPSTGWDAALPRVCTYTLLQESKTQKKLYVFNTHFDHVGTEARENAAKLIVQKISEINTDNLPIILMGDFNSKPASKVVELLSTMLNNSMLISQQKFTGSLGTFNAFDVNYQSEKPIDYIFVKNLKVEKYEHVPVLKADGSFISDHRPVLIKIE